LPNHGTLRLNNDDGDVSFYLLRKYQLFTGIWLFNKHCRFKETAMFCLEEMKVGPIWYLLF